MVDESVPFCGWECRVAKGKAGEEVVFPGLDCSFCGIAAVAVRRDALVLYVVFLEGIAEVCRAFIVQDVEFGGVAVAL